MNLVNHFYQLRSIIPNSYKPKKIYFLENLILDPLTKGLEAFEKNISLYNKLVNPQNWIIVNKTQTSNEKV